MRDGVDPLIARQRALITSTQNRQLLPVGDVTTDEVRSLLDRAALAHWTDVPPAGIGTQRRATVDQWSASVLSLDDELVHGSFVRAPTAAMSETAH